MVVIRPQTTPMRSCKAFTSGARQFVVHDAFEITVCAALSVLWLTPMTMVASTSLPPGAEMMTFFAPADRWADAFSLLVKRPVHSSTTSTLRSFHGSSAGLRLAHTWMRSPLTISASPSTATVPGNLHWNGSYRDRWAVVWGY